jgi:hypothetical protein
MHSTCLKCASCLKTMTDGIVLIRTIWHAQTRNNISMIAWYMYRCNIVPYNNNKKTKSIKNNVLVAFTIRWNGGKFICKMFLAYFALMFHIHYMIVILLILHITIKVHLGSIFITKKKNKIASSRSRSWIQNSWKIKRNELDVIHRKINRQYRVI